MQEGFERDLNPGVSRRVEPVPPISTCLICDYAGGLGLNGQGGMLVGPENPVFAGSSRSFTTSRRRKCYAWPTSMDCMHICTEDREHFNLHTQTQTHTITTVTDTKTHTMNHKNRSRSPIQSRPTSVSGSTVVHTYLDGPCISPSLLPILPSLSFTLYFSCGSVLCSNSPTRH